MASITTTALAGEEVDAPLATLGEAPAFDRAPEIKLAGHVFWTALHIAVCEERRGNLLIAVAGGMRLSKEM